MADDIQQLGWYIDNNGNTLYYVDAHTYLKGLTSLPVNQNLFKNSTATQGFVNWGGGVQANDTDWSSDFIAIEAGQKQVTLSTFDDNVDTGRTSVCFYDQNKNYLSKPMAGARGAEPFQNNMNNTFWTTIDIPDNVKYIRVSFGGDTIKKNSMKKVEFGNAFTSWVPADGDYDTVLDAEAPKALYYFDNNGYLQRGGTVIVDEIEYYINALYGIATNGSVPQYDLGLETISDDYTPHNALYAVDKESIDNVDGFLTADTWYRPKDILENGTTWRASNNDEKRPVLMTWTPDKLTLVNYVNYMASVNVIPQDVVYTINSDVNSLISKQRQIQVALEKDYASDIEKLKTLFKAFIVTQDIWNKKSEYFSNDHLQGGALRFVNDDGLPNTNSNHRLFNRYPKNQDGHQKDDTGYTGGYELLLANDIDNSNPAVQAEQLNWLYFLNHFGSLVFGDDDANFDGIRIDAVDNVDADLLQITGDYYNEVIGTKDNPNKANDNISILEDWDYGDFDYMGRYGQTQLTIDPGVKDGLITTLGVWNEAMKPMSTVISSAKVNRTKAYGNNRVVANYSFVRAHDSESQDIIAECIGLAVPGADGRHPTWEQVAEGFDYYRKDMESTLKYHTRNNIPAMYALLLTNKDTVPRVYYGDMFYEAGQYMANKTIYAPAIETMLKWRKAVVAGGQTMHVDNDVLVSVRFGKGIDTVDDDTKNLTADELLTARISGCAVLVSNKKDLALGDKTITVDMGPAHINQQFQQVVSTSSGSFVINPSGYKSTNEKGQLILNSNDIFGMADPYCWGHVSMWVPADADISQDIREFTDTNKYTDGNTYHSGEVLDSHVIFEGFSNFTALPTTPEERANVVIQSKTDYFKELGITIFEFAPQYRSSTDGSFLDSVIQNGYAFTDRYDLGFDTPTKYGTVEDLRNAIKALHQAGIQAMCDFVPDQLYSLPVPEIVATTRTNSSGILRDKTRFEGLYYMAMTKSSGSDYQAKYGGKYLNIMMMTAPKIFERLQISTGEKINPYEQIEQWSAKYFNGTNTQGRGAYYVLKDFSSDRYFNINQDSLLLPTQLTGQTTQFGFVKNGNDIQYYTLSGLLSRNTFIKDDKNNWYYFDENGNMATETMTIKGYDYHFMPNGIELTNYTFTDINGQDIYTNSDGKVMKAYRVILQDGLYVLKENKGILASGWQVLDTDNKYYQFESGHLFSGFKIVNGRYHFFYRGDKLTNSFQNVAGVTFFVDDAGDSISGLKYANNQLHDFGHDNSYWLKKSVGEKKPDFLN
ncbi:glycoside hydrolase family 70 protein [Leuconostoc suionicum]|uniref:glycoside hydrolase family 70 protein n=2 Tax=Leuconostoc suionicum TaxID=1511761 RepID=UPI0024AD5431|nr:glycoside hydrolase family 70 protein [Leuconostoc suionicum]MDI6498933.1 glycoside hydrolase family 70 protein [Leuconostoc suionicum]MDI6499947.1 glycoside hydrolase family 70 protein [Leuconostoc suionicum]